MNRTALHVALLAAVLMTAASAASAAPLAAVAGTLAERIVIPSGIRGYIRLVLPAGLHGDRLRALRILDERNAEVPYALDPAFTEAARANEAAILASFAREEVSGEERFFFRLPAGTVPTHVRFPGGGGTFSRAIDVQLRNAAGDYSTVAVGEIHRYDDGERSVDLTLPPLGAQTDVQVRVIVRNASDAPVPGMHPELVLAAEDLVFPAAPGHVYRLVAPDPGAEAPQYDLGVRLAHGRPHAATTIRLRPDLESAPPTVSNRNAVVASWTDAHPLAIPVIFAVAAVVLGGTAIHVMRSPENASPT